MINSIYISIICHFDRSNHGNSKQFYISLPVNSHFNTIVFEVTKSQISHAYKHLVFPWTVVKVRCNDGMEVHAYAIFRRYSKRIWWLEILTTTTTIVTAVVVSENGITFRNMNGM